jgi:sialic acid synthase SpsE
MIKINDIEIGRNTTPVVIAEIGINHGGCLTEAKKIALAAIKSGVQIIKHQTHIIEDEMSCLAKQTIPGNSDKSIYEIMSECALNEEDEFKLKRFVEDNGAVFISTPFSRAAVDRLIKFDVPAFKIGSGECNNLPLLRYICQFGKPVILSTGMNTLAQVDEAVKIFHETSTPFALLHTTNLYPTPPELVRLGAITELLERYPDAPIGLSDHTVNNLACFGAVALGATILERHFTDTMDRKGPDIVCSMDPQAAKELIEGSYTLFLERGGTKFNALPEEQVTREFAFATVVSIQDIECGEELNMKNIWVKRPGVGEIKAKEFEGLLGKKAKRFIRADEHLCWNDVE